MRLPDSEMYETLAKNIIKYLLIIVIIGYYHFTLYSMGAVPGGLQRFILPVVPFYAYFVSIFIIKSCKI